MKQKIMICPACNAPALDEDRSFCKKCLNTEGMGNRWLSWNDWERGEEF